MLLLPGLWSRALAEAVHWSTRRARAKVVNSPKIGSKQGCMTPPQFVRSQLMKTHWKIEAKITWSSQHKRTDFAEIKAIARRGPGLKEG